MMALLPVWALLWWLFQPDFSAVTWTNILLALPVILLGFGISFLLGATITSVAFWTTAGGGGASDPTVSRIIADIEGEGAYRAAVALYEGEDQARKARMGAAAERYEGQLAAVSGENAYQAGNIMAATSLLTGGASLYEKYKGATSSYTAKPGYMPSMSRSGSFGH